MTKAKRLAPTSDTIRELFLKSGNVCAFAGCGKLMMNADGVFVGQICHIEAAVEGGERFNVTMTNEERRSFQNLLLMCYEHHVITNDVVRYPATELRKIKADHEARFSSPDRTILATLKDWTTAESAVPPTNMRRANRVFGWGHSDEDLAETAITVRRYLEHLVKVPLEVRSFLGKVIQRHHRLTGASARQRRTSELSVACSDLEKAFRLSSDELKRQVQDLQLYDLGDIDRVTLNSGHDVPAVLIHNLDGWPFWIDIAAFCVSENVQMETFSELLDFSSLDE